LPVEFEGIYFCHIAKTRDDDENTEDEPAGNGDEPEDGDSGYQNKKWLKDEIEELLSRNYI